MGTAFGLFSGMKAPNQRSLSRVEAGAQVTEMWEETTFAFGYRVENPSNLWARGGGTEGSHGAGWG